MRARSPTFSFSRSNSAVVVRLCSGGQSICGILFAAFFGSTMGPGLGLTALPGQRYLDSACRHLIGGDPPIDTPVFGIDNAGGFAALDRISDHAQFSDDV